VTNTNLASLSGVVSTINTNLSTLSGSVATLQSQVALLQAQAHDAVTLSIANGLTLSGQQLSLRLASATTTGALSPTDWNMFNAKVSTVSAGSFIGVNNLGANQYSIDNLGLVINGNSIEQSGYGQIGYSDISQNILFLGSNTYNG
jgi:hypothetical protein